MSRTMYRILLKNNSSTCVLKTLTNSKNIQVRNLATNASKIANDIIRKELAYIREQGTYKDELVITSKQSANITVEGLANPVLNFCANNYLGLSSHPDIVEAGKLAYDQYGAGISSVRFICGTQNIHKSLENKIAKFHSQESCILYASCFDANAGLFETLLTKEDAVISDELNHASIIDGIRLCKAKRQRYKHRDIKDLEKQLKESHDCRLRLIATDGVFSMDGNVTPLEQICDLADKYNALVFVDDSHASGFFGKTGRFGKLGTAEFLGVAEQRVDIVNSTLGKALGGASGGYTAASQQVVELLRNRSRPYLFSNSLPPPVVATASKVFDILTSSSELIEKLKVNMNIFRSRMTEAGFNIAGDKEHPICPVMLGDAKLSANFAKKMLDEGIFVISFSYPVVAKGKERIRVQISAGHSADEVNKAVDAFIKVGKNLKVIK